MNPTTYRVYICTGPNCGPKGSARLVDALQEEIDSLGLQEKVSILAGGCQSHCETGPSLVVYPGPVFYQYVDKGRLRRIAREHLSNGAPVSDYLWVDPAKRPWRERPSPLKSGPASPPTFGSKSEEKSRKEKPRKTYDVDDFKW